MTPSKAMSEGEQHQDRKIINWPEYNQTLVKLGSLTLWFDKDIQSVWFHKKAGKTGRGLDKTFSDTAFQTCLMLRLHYKLSPRSMEGFVNSLFKPTGLPLTCPHHTVFSKGRGKQLNIPIPRRLPTGPVDIMIDATGLKMYGEGEWKVRKHGVGKRRTWRKLRLGVDPNTHDIVVDQLTTVELGDGETLPDLLDQLGGDQAPHPPLGPV